MKFKLPLIQNVAFIDNRLREWDGEPSDLLTIDKDIEVNTWARWQSPTPSCFQALRMKRQGSVLDGLIDASVKCNFGSDADGSTAKYQA